MLIREIKGEIVIKLFAILLTAIGIIFSVFGLMPVIFVYPFKYWDTASDYWNYILLQAHDRVYWQVGIIILLIGLFLLFKIRKR